MSLLVLDIATSGLPNVKDFVTTDDITPPSNYVKPEAIKSFVDKEVAKRIDKAGLEPDTCRITAIGVLWAGSHDTPSVALCRTEEEEAAALEVLALTMRTMQPTLVGFNSSKFDWPILMRRALYLRVPLPPINLDRYRSPHVDLYERLTYRGTVTGHSLQWYVKRLGWTDLVKPLTGAEEAQVPTTGKWDELTASVTCDLLATARLADWLELRPVDAVVEEVGL